MSSDKWIEQETRFQEKFNNVKIHYHPSTTITVKVLRGEDIHVGYLHDSWDVPDPKVSLECSGASGRKRFNTKVARDTENPEWNESFTFILPDGKESATIKVDVYEEDVFRDACLGSLVYDTAHLEVDKSQEVLLDMKEHGKVYMEILKRRRTGPDCRLSHGLSEDERRFRIERKPKTMKALLRLLGKDRGPKSLSETPTVGLAITGGGYRAMASCCGAMEALAENDIVDTLMYIAGLSGSSWYISTSYQKKSLKTLETLVNHHDWIRSRSARSFYSFIWDLGFFSRWRKYRRYKIKNGQETTLVDMFGLRLGETFLEEKNPNSTLSSLRSYVETAEVPFPLLSCSHVHENLPMSEFCDEVELTPFEISFPGYGINIPTDKFNSRWGNGILQQELPEPPLHFMMGTSGCAFGILWSKIDDKTEASTDFRETLDAVYQEHRGVKDSDSDDEDSEEDKIDGSKNFASKEDNFMEQLRASRSKEVVDGPIADQLFSLGRNFLIEKTSIVNSAVKSFVNLQKFRLDTEVVNSENAKGRIAKTTSTKKNTMVLCDTGIICNLPAVHIMRPQRTIDVLIVVDCAPYKSEEFLDLESFASVQRELDLHGIKFPCMSIQKIADDPFREVYLFEDTEDSDCPVVIWFTLANGIFRKLANPPRRPGYPKPDPVDEGKAKFNDFTITPDSEEYSVTKLQSEPLSFDRLRELIKHNISINIQLVKDKIAGKVEALRKREQKSHSTTF